MRRRYVLAAAVVVTLALAGCSSRPGAGSAAAGPEAPDPAVQATAGTLTISGGYVPVPASPDVAAAYFLVSDVGTAGDELVSAQSDAGPASLHRTENGAMVMLDGLAVPGRGSVALEPGGDHLMIEPLTRTLTRGDTIRVTLTFRDAGSVSVPLPVTDYAGTTSSP